ncbi:hypothetical protein WS67_11615 [Burkholderia singularis]|uniref:Uncharacterized protein n=2 Tax=Burkholderia singularis TaxID=1503053 RepID=A0A103E311_9BURK|nr:hypothetical protein WS67_11615 [Burkholderia singularis]
MNVSRMAILAISVVAIVLGLLSKGRNLAFLVALAYTVVVSSNLPPRALSMYWKGLTSRSTVWGDLVKFISSVGLVLVSFTAWKTVLGNRCPSSPMHLDAAFHVARVVVSKLDRSLQAETK